MRSDEFIVAVLFSRRDGGASKSTIIGRGELNLSSAFDCPDPRSSMVRKGKRGTVLHSTIIVAVVLNLVIINMLRRSVFSAPDNQGRQRPSINLSNGECWEEFQSWESAHAT